MVTSERTAAASPMQDAARRLVAAGLSVIPILPDGSKAPALNSWKRYQSERPTVEELRQWFRNGSGIALICGEVSGNVECIDFDEPEAFAQWWAALTDDDDPSTSERNLLERLVITRTPGPGMQVWYRCGSPVAGNQKLARRPPTAEEVNRAIRARAQVPKWVVVVETRGEGGYGIIPPSPAACHPSGRAYEMFLGDFAALPVLTADERETLLDAARALNTYVEPAKRVAGGQQEREQRPGERRPGDDYNARADISALLEECGWTLKRRVGAAEHWLRPGSDAKKRCSATLGAVAPGILYVFSTNAAPFEAEKSYDPFGVYALLRHGGDFAAAGRALREQGFGSPPAGSNKGGADRGVRPGRPGSAVEAPLAADGCDGADYDKDNEPGEERGVETKEPSAHDLAREWTEQVRGRFCFREGDEWGEYNGRCWEGVTESVVTAAVQLWLEGRQGMKVKITPHQIRSIVTLSQAMLTEAQDGRPMRRVWFDPTNETIPFENGVLCLYSGRLFPHHYERYNTRCLPYRYDPAAECPRFQRFLHESMIHADGTHAKEWAELLLEWMGYCLIPDSRAEKILINVGEGGNGKSVWNGVLERLVGHNQCHTLDPKRLAEKPEYELASLFGKTVGFIQEPKPQDLLGCWGAIKAISSGDTVSGRPPYGRETFSFNPRARLVIACNEVPDTRDLKRALFRRLLFVEWRHVPAKADRSLDRVLAAETSGILNLALKGLARLAARDWQFNEPEESVLLKREYRRRQDAVEQWLEESWRPDPASFTPIETLYQDFAAWCVRSGEKSMTKRKFSDRLTMLGHITDKQKDRGVSRNGRHLRRPRPGELDE